MDYVELLRILGSGDFVERVLKETDETLTYQFPTMQRGQKVKKFIRRVCKKENVNIEKLQMGAVRDALRNSLFLFMRYPEPMGITGR